jgi:hypothetical protein
MTRASCHCGAVVREVDSPPAEVTDCHFSICRRYGTLWAYYPPEWVRVLPADPPTDVYVWGDKTLETHRCRVCGCDSHWVAMDPGVDLMGVNARLMDPEVLSAARTRYSDCPPSRTPRSSENSVNTKFREYLFYEVR